MFFMCVFIYEPFMRISLFSPLHTVNEKCGRTPGLSTRSPDDVTFFWCPGQSSYIEWLQEWFPQIKHTVVIAKILCLIQHFIGTKIYFSIKLTRPGRRKWKDKIRMTRIRQTQVSFTRPKKATGYIFRVSKHLVLFELITLTSACNVDPCRPHFPHFWGQMRFVG